MRTVWESGVREMDMGVCEEVRREEKRLSKGRWKEVVSKEGKAWWKGESFPRKCDGISCNYIFVRKQQRKLEM